MNCIVCKVSTFVISSPIISLNVFQTHFILYYLSFYLSRSLSSFLSLFTYSVERPHPLFHFRFLFPALSPPPMPFFQPHSLASLHLISCSFSLLSPFNSYHSLVSAQGYGHAGSYQYHFIMPFLANFHHVFTRALYSSDLWECSIFNKRIYL